MSPIGVRAADDEELLVRFLLADQSVAGAVGTKVGAKLPTPLTLPRVRVRRLGGTSPPPGWIDRPRIQIECLGNDDAEAKDLANTVRAALAGIVGAHPLGVVTSIDELNGPQWLPDVVGDQRTPGTPRYLFTVVMTVHPNP